MNGFNHRLLADPCTNEEDWPILICLLGNFRLLKTGQPLPIPCGGKIEALFGLLALQYGRRVSRERLAHALWSVDDPALIKQSLNSLIYSVHKLLNNANDGPVPVLHSEGYYRLNVEAGVGVDVTWFDALVQAGDQQLRAGASVAATTLYSRAVGLYRGDLCIGIDVHAAVERERLRTRYLTLLAQLADYYFRQQDYAACMEYAWRLLLCDPCREDAHRVLMRCFIRRGERTAALRHYHHCVDLLRAEFDVAPESTTTALFDQIRLHPDSI